MKHELLQYLENNFVPVSAQGVQNFVDGLKSVIDKYDEPLTGTGCAEASTGGGIVGDNCTAQPFDYVAEAKRQTLHHLLISVAERNGGLTAVGAAELVNEGYTALAGQPGNDELTAALLTISNIQNALNLPGQKGISEEVIELVRNMQTNIDTRTQSVAIGPVIGLNFSTALEWVNAGYAVTRDGWNTLPTKALRRVNAKGKGRGDVLVTFFPVQEVPEFTIYDPTQGDLLATDWTVLNEPR